MYSNKGFIIPRSTIPHTGSSFYAKGTISKTNYFEKKNKIYEYTLPQLKSDFLTFLQLIDSDKTPSNELKTRVLQIFSKEELYTSIAAGALHKFQAQQGDILTLVNRVVCQNPVSLEFFQGELSKAICEQVKKSPSSSVIILLASFSSVAFDKINKIIFARFIEKILKNSDSKRIISFIAKTKYTAEYFFCRSKAIINKLLKKDNHHNYLAEIIIHFIHNLIYCTANRDQSDYFLDDLNRSINIFDEFNLLSNDHFNYLNYPLVLSLENRIKIFSIIDGEKSIMIDAVRGNEFECFIKTMIESGTKIISKIYVDYENEAAKDQGGPIKEFMNLALQSATNDSNLFVKTDDGQFWLNPSFPFHALEYEAVGILIGYLIRNKIAVKPRFDKLLYKKLVGEEITENDISGIDPSSVTIFSNLRSMKENNEDISDLEYTFTMLQKGPNGYEEVPIVEGGNNIPVTNNNLEYFIACYVDFVASKSVEKQFESFAIGFKCGCLNFDQLFTADELDVMVSGKVETDWASMVDSITFEGFAPESDAPAMFYAVFMDLSDAERSHLLWFMSGLSTEPISGFAQLELRIVRGADTSLLPVAHTCIREMVLPEYETIEEMKRSIKICIENAEGFGFI